MAQADRCDLIRQRCRPKPRRHIEDIDSVVVLRDPRRRRVITYVTFVNPEGNLDAAKRGIDLKGDRASAVGSQGHAEKTTLSLRL